MNNSNKKWDSEEIRNYLCVLPQRAQLAQDLINAIRDDEEEHAFTLAAALLIGLPTTEIGSFFLTTMYNSMRESLR